jgi:hypothetical protein
MPFDRSLRGLVAASIVCLAASPAWGQDSDDTATEDEWVIGNLVFLAYHEVGHLLLDQIAQADQRNNRLLAEQSADDIATWLISPDPGEEIESSEAIAAIDGWLEMADAGDDSGAAHLPDAEIYPDAVTRASRIACLLLGSDDSEPNAFAPLEPVAALSFEIADCRETYLALDKDMEELFGDADDFGENPVARVRVQYDAVGPALAEARAFLVESGVLDALRDDLVEYIGLPVDVVLRGAACGRDSPGFVYNPSRREIVACYEEVDWYLFGEPEDGASGAEQDPAARDGLGSRPRRIAPRPPPPPPSSSSNPRRQ